VDNGERVLIREAIWTRSFVFVCLSNLAILANVHTIMPTLPLYVSTIGSSEKVIGFVIGVFPITAMALRPVVGMLLDKFGRKVLLFLGVAMTALICGSYILASTLMLLILARFLHGVAFSLSHTAIGTVAVDVLPPKRLGQGIGYFGLTSSISMAIAPAVGLWMAEKNGFFPLFLLSTSLAVLALILSFIATYGTDERNTIKKATIDKGLSWSDFVEIKAIPASIIVGLIAMLFGAVVTILVLFANQNGIANIGIFFTVNALAMIISRPLADGWCNKKGERVVMLGGAAMLALCVFIITLSNNINHIIIAGVFYGLGLGFCIPVLQTMAIRDVLPQRRGAATGNFYSAFDLGIGAGAIIWAWIGAVIGYRWAFLLNLVPISLAGILYCYFYIRKLSIDNEQKP